MKEQQLTPPEIRDIDVKSIERRLRHPGSANVRALLSMHRAQIIRALSVHKDAPAYLSTLLEEINAALAAKPVTLKDVAAVLHGLLDKDVLSPREEQFLIGIQSATSELTGTRKGKTAAQLVNDVQAHYYIEHADQKAKRQSTKQLAERLKRLESNLTTAV